MNTDKHLYLLSLMLLGFLCGCASTEIPLTTRLRDIEFHSAAGMDDKQFDGPLPLKSAIELAVERSEEVATARAAMRVAEERKRAAADSRDPELRFGYGEGQLDSEVSTQPMSSAVRDDESYSVALRVFPQNPFERHHRISAAAANSRAAAADLWQAEWRIAIETRKLFAEIACLQSETNLLEQLVTTQREALNITRDLMAHGQATMQDVMISSRQYLSALSDRDAGARDLDQARETLASHLGLPAAGLEIAVDEHTFSNPDIRSADAGKLAEAALDNRLDLVALRWRVIAAEAARREAEAARVPWFPQIQASYSMESREARETLGSNALGLDPDLPSDIQNTDVAAWSVDAGLTIPIFSWTKNHAADALAAEHKQARIVERHAREKVYRNVVNALDSMRSVQKSQLNYRAETAPIVFDMEATLDNVERASGLPPDEIARIKREILQVARLKIQTERRFRLAAIKLDEVLGAPFEKLQPDAKSQEHRAKR